jgi:hypothetical protein
MDGGGAEGFVATGDVRSAVEGASRAEKPGICVVPQDGEECTPLQIVSAVKRVL